jgi:hypothetical protein
MGKLLPVPGPNESMEEYREKLINFKKTYWDFLKPKSLKKKNDKKTNL